MPNIATRFGDLLRQHRKRRSLQLGQMSDALGVPPSVLSDVELGRRQPFKRDAIEQCRAILNLTDTETEELISAASESRRVFELAFVDGKPQANSAATALMREWPALPDEAYAELEKIVRSYKKGG